MIPTTQWSGEALPIGQSIDRVLYDLRRDDAGESLLLDSTSIADIIEDSDGMLSFDALVMPFAQIERKMALLNGIMQRTVYEVKTVSVQVSEPFKQRGVANVAAVFELSDGQTVSIFFHNPDVTPNKMAGTDEIISWKWLLNKKDITIVVAPERGEDLNVREVARRIMKLAEKNSAAFQRANGKRAETLQRIEGIKAEVVGLEKELKTALSDLEVAKFKKEEGKPVNPPAANGWEETPERTAVSRHEQAWNSLSKKQRSRMLTNEGVSPNTAEQHAAGGYDDLPGHFLGRIEGALGQVAANKGLSPVVEVPTTAVAVAEVAPEPTPTPSPTMTLPTEVTPVSPVEIEITGKELGDFPDTPEGKKELRESAKTRLESMVGTWVPCPALGGDVEIRKKGIKEFISRSADARKLKLAAAIIEIIRSSKFLKKREPYNAEIDNNAIAYHTLRAHVALEGTPFAIRIVVKEDLQGKFHYDMTVHDFDAVFDSAKSESHDESQPSYMTSSNGGGACPSRMASHQPDSIVGNERKESNPALDSTGGTRMMINLFIEGEEPEVVEAPAPAPAVAEVAPTPPTVMTLPTEVISANPVATVVISEAIEIAVKKMNGFVSTGDGRVWELSKSALNKMIANENAEGEKPYQKERIIAIQYLSEIANSASFPDIRSDDGRDDRVESIYEYRTKFDVLGNIRGVRLLCKKYKNLSKRLKDKMHSMAMDDLGSPITQIDTDGMFFDLEITGDGEGLVSMGQQLPPSAENDLNIASSDKPVNSTDGHFGGDEYPPVVDLSPEGRESKVKTAKGTEVVTGFSVVEADRLITSHSPETGDVNPEFPQELQPRDRGRETSRAWVMKTAANLDPEQLGKTRRADTGAPIVGPDRVVESGNGRTMAIVEAYRIGKADEYREWLESEAEYFGLSADKIKTMSRPVLVRVRTSAINRAEFSVEANQDDKLAMTATEKARSDANRLTENMISLMTDNGDLSASSNIPFLSAFLTSLGDAEAAQYSTREGKPTSTLIARVQAAIFAKAYNDDRLLELTADSAKPEIGNIINALNYAASEFIQAAALDPSASSGVTKKLVDSVETSLNAQAVSAIIGATNILKNAKELGMQVDEFVKQRGLFGDLDPSVASMAVFISKNNRSAKRMGIAFKAMASFVRKEIERRQTSDIFGEAETSIGFPEIIAAANRELDRAFGEGSFKIETGDLFLPPSPS